MAAHVRKAYPRDEFTPAGKEDSESATQTHRTLRRGIPYGAPYVAHDPDSAKVDRGLLFLCYSAGGHHLQSDTTTGPLPIVVSILGQKTWIQLYPGP